MCFVICVLFCFDCLASDVDGLSEEQMPSLSTMLSKKQHLQDYAKTKAQGEVAVHEACCDELMTVAIAPHQVKQRQSLQSERLAATSS
jgi:hypothetical protein